MVMVMVGVGRCACMFVHTCVCVVFVIFHPITKESLWMDLHKIWHRSSHGHSQLDIVNNNCDNFSYQLRA